MEHLIFALGVIDAFMLLFIPPMVSSVVAWLPEQMHTLAYVGAFLWIFWGLYAIVMNLWRSHLKGTLTKTQKVLGAPYLAAGAVVDVVCQYTIACVIFAGPPRFGEHLVTQRMLRLRREEPTSWRGKLAEWLCEQGLDSLDPRGSHC